MWKKCKVVILLTDEKAELRPGYYKDVLSLTETKHKQFLSIFRSMNGMNIPNPLTSLYLI